MWDFPTMNKTVQYYRAISPCESHQLRSIEFSPGSDMLLIASGSCQGKVISRDGKNMYECARGDMYLIDMQKTKGHVSTLNRACWNPKDLNVSLFSQIKTKLISFFFLIGIYDLFR